MFDSSQPTVTYLTDMTGTCLRNGQSRYVCSRGNKVNRWIYIGLYYKPFISKALRYGPRITKPSQSFTCHSHTNHTCLYFAAARRHRPFAGTHCAYPRRDGHSELTCSGWSHTEINAWHWELNPDTVTHLSTNRAWRRVTSLMCATPSPLSEAAANKHLVCRNVIARSMKCVHLLHNVIKDAMYRYGHVMGNITYQEGYYARMC